MTNDSMNQNYKLAPVKRHKPCMYPFTAKALVTNKQPDTYSTGGSMAEESDGGNQALEMRTRAYQ